MASASNDAPLTFEQPHTLERVIFGDGSELSSEEEDVPQQRPRQKPAPVDHEPEPSSAESSDAYEQERPQKQKRKTRRRTDDRDGRQAQKKRKRKQITEEDLIDLPPEKANKLRLDMQFDAILKPKKGSRVKKRKKDDEDSLDRFADEEVSRLREAMLGAAADDEQANRDRLPAVNKLRLLPQVLEVLRKQSLSQSIVDNNLLEGVRRWLEPLPDRSLPALNIQRDFFPILRKMEFIDGSVLKESGLGRIVLFYTKCKRVNPEIHRIANDLICIWSRPIIKRSASYRDRVIRTAKDDTTEHANERLNAILARAKEGEKNRIRKNAVMIPYSDLGSYTVAPKANAGVLRNSQTVESDIARRKLNAERMRSLSRKMSTKP